MAQSQNTGEYWAQKAYETSDNKGKELRRNGFARAEERYGKVTSQIRMESSQWRSLILLAEYKPILGEVEKILAEAGLDEDEMRRGAALGGGPAGSGQSRNRRWCVGT